MLILTRRIGESVVIEGNIYCTLLAVKGNQARFGIGAPKEITIHREEVHERLKKEAKQLAKK